MYIVYMFHTIYLKRSLQSGSDPKRKIGKIGHQDAGAVTKNAETVERKATIKLQNQKRPKQSAQRKKEKKRSRAAVSLTMTVHSI